LVPDIQLYCGHQTQDIRLQCTKFSTKFSMCTQCTVRVGSDTAAGPRRRSAPLGLGAGAPKNQLLNKNIGKVMARRSRTAQSHGGPAGAC